MSYVRCDSFSYTEKSVYTHTHIAVKRRQKLARESVSSLKSLIMPSESVGTTSHSLTTEVMSRSTARDSSMSRHAGTPYVKQWIGRPGTTPHDSLVTKLPSARGVAHGSRPATRRQHQASVQSAQARTRDDQSTPFELRPAAHRDYPYR